MKRLIGKLLAASVFMTWLATGNLAHAGFSTTEIQLHHGDGYKLGRNGNFPTFSNTTTRSTITVDHFSTNDVGDLFFFVDFFYDGEKLSPDSRTVSDQYGEIYYHLHGNHFGLGFGDSGFIKALDFGVSLNQGTDVSIALAGPRISLNAPGFRVLSLGAYAYNNFSDPFKRNLDTTQQFTVVWDRPFDIGSQKYLFKGFVDFIGSQGSGVSSQVIFSPQIRWDIGHAMGKGPGKIDLGVEYNHFGNKFGISGVDENSASVFVGFRF